MDIEQYFDSICGISNLLRTNTSFSQMRHVGREVGKNQVEKHSGFSVIQSLPFIGLVLVCLVLFHSCVL